MRGLLAFSSAVDALSERIGTVANWLVLAAVLLSAGNAVSRYALSLTSNGLLEAQWYMFGGIVFLGAAHTLRRNEHVRVDVVYSLLPARGRLLIDIFGLILFLLPATIFLGWLCWPVFMRAFRLSEMSSNYGGLLRWPILAVLPFGFALLTLQGVSELIKRVAALAGASETGPHYARPLQ